MEGGNYFIGGLGRSFACRVKFHNFSLAKSFHRIIEGDAQDLAANIFTDLCRIISSLFERHFKLIRGPAENRGPVDPRGLEHIGCQVTYNDEIIF